MAQCYIKIHNLPHWVDRKKLLGDYTWQLFDSYVETRLEQIEAAKIIGRLGKTYLDGQEIICETFPKLKSSTLREGKLSEARNLRNKSQGFKRKGVRRDEVGHFSLTPEDIALELGRRACGRSVLDICCGSGGNAIGFARGGSKVTAIELNKGRLSDARHNANVYGCRSKIEFKEGDALRFISTVSADILWVDPPWGEYEKSGSERKDFPLMDELLKKIKKDQFNEVWLKLPSSFLTSSLLDFHVEAIYGTEQGDQHRIKFLLLTRKYV